MAAASDREVLTPEQIAEYLQVRRETVYRYIREGKLPAIKLGRSYRVPREDLEMFLLSNRTAGDVRDALFERVLRIAKSRPTVPLKDIERDVAEAVAAVRSSRRA